MDPKLHTLIPLMGSVALTFSAGCFEDKASDDATAESSETGGDSISQALADHCQAMADCDAEGEFAYYTGTAEECAEEMTSYALESGEACLEATVEYYECYNDIAYCNEDGTYLTYSSEACGDLYESMSDACYDDDDYDDYDY